MSLAIPVFAFVWLVLINVVLYLLNENSVLKRFGLDCNFFYRSTNGFQERPQDFLAWDILEAKDMVSDQVNHRTLLTLRFICLLSFLFCCIAQEYFGSGYGSPSGSWLIYFTNWTFTGFALVSLVGCAVVIENSKNEKYKNIWTPLKKLHLLMFEVIAPSSAFLTAFYWAVLYEGDTPKFDNIMRHGVSALLLVIDLLMTRIPIVSYHFQVALLYGSVYMIFAFFYFLASGDWVYDVFDWEKTSAVGYYIALPLLLGIGFCLMYGIASLRERFMSPRQDKYNLQNQNEVQMGALHSTDRVDFQL